MQRRAVEGGTRFVVGETGRTPSVPAERVTVSGFKVIPVCPLAALKQLRQFSSLLDRRSIDQYLYLSAAKRGTQPPGLPRGKDVVVMSVGRYTPKGLDSNGFYFTLNFS